MNEPAASPALLASLAGQTPLPHLGVILAHGDDAASFLHNQFTQDMLLLPVGQSRLAAWCNAKGRMQASLLVIKAAPDRFWLVLRQDLLPQTLRRLSMFVLRAKVKLSDASAQCDLLGLLGSASPLGAGAAPMQTQCTEGGCTVALHPAHWGGAVLARALRLTPREGTPPASIDAPALGLDDWTWAEVVSGVPLIGAAVFEAFVPQMLNYESVGGVNFKKGCYPGQEVVARSQFRGVLKRRMGLFTSPAPLQAGDPVFSAEDPEQACGTVVLSAPRPGGGAFEALVSATVSGLAQGLHLSSAEGPALVAHPLPYALLEDI